jgi:hypothetical protein
MHVSIGHYSRSGASISTQVAALRGLLMGWSEEKNEESYWWGKVRNVSDSHASTTAKASLRD